jgi:hypothetical protein
MGKKNKLRACPAEGRSIEALECALSRHGTYSCPETCEFNHFSAAHYAQYGEIEQSTDKKLIDWSANNVTDRSQFEAGVESRTFNEPHNSYFHFIAWHVFYRIDTNGETCVGKWAKSNFAGLNADERIVMRGRLQTRPAMLEVHRILDDKRIEVVDLLDSAGKSFIIVDRSLASLAVRFGTYGAHIYPTPHFYRLFGACLLFPDLPPFESVEIIRAIIAHLGGGNDETSMRLWLKEHFEKFENSLWAVGLARRRLMFDKLDAQFGKAVYELFGSFDECCARLRTVAQIANDSLNPDEQSEGFVEGRVWFALPDDADYDRVGPNVTLGRILVGKTHWRLQAMGAERLARFRQRFESVMNGLVRFVGERRDDLAKQLKLKDPNFDMTLVPPALLENPQQIVTSASRVCVPRNEILQEEFMSKFLHEQDIKFLDENVAALDGHTPRQAAVDTLLRPKLVGLIKERIRGTDKRNLETGRNDDINWMVRELKLDEILFEPPPKRPCPKILCKDFDDDLLSDDREDDPKFLRLPLPPALPDRPWGRNEAAKRILQAMKEFPNPDDLVDYLNDLDYPLLQDIDMTVDDFLSDNDFDFVLPTLALVVLCFAPRGTQPPDIDVDELEDAYDSEVETFRSWRPSNFAIELERRIERSSQPALMSSIMTVLQAQIDEMPKDLKPDETSPITYALLIAMLVDVLDSAMRDRPQS